LEFDRVSLEFELFLRVASQFNGSATDRPLLISFNLTTVEKGLQRNLLSRYDGDIGDQRENRGESDLRLVPIILGCFEKVVSLGRRIAPFMRGFRHP